MQSRIMLIMEYGASTLVDIFRQFVMLCQFLHCYKRKLVGFKDIRATDEVRLDDCKNQLKESRRI